MQTMSTLAILGGEKVRSEPFPQWPVFDERDIQAVTDVLKSGRWGGFPYPGPNTSEFLKRFTEMQGGGYPVLMVNGTVTMEVALRAADIGWGDEVIVPALTFQPESRLLLPRALAPSFLSTSARRWLTWTRSWISLTATT
jgi:dTDP-4-amino-4,6-dideoxygalactose transaminase